VGALLEAGREVVVLGRRDPGAVRLPAAARYIRGDYADRATLREVLAGAEDVIDLAYATVPQTSFVDPVFDILANLPPSVGLLQEALDAGLKRVVLVSSGGTVYGRAERLPLDEEHPTRPISPYGITKLTIEQYARMYHSSVGLPVIVVRPANAYGETQRSGAGQGFVASAVHAVARGLPVVVFGSRGTVRDYVHVSDVAGGIVAALSRGIDGETYNLGTGIGIDNLQVLEMLRPLAAASGLDVQVDLRPARSFDVPANVLDASRLERMTGWRPLVPFADGLHRVWRAARGSAA
jgi:UDP-glucose 4-epimerase